jgi:hypothetical protein
MYQPVDRLTTRACLTIAPWGMGRSCQNFMQPIIGNLNRLPGWKVTPNCGSLKDLKAPCFLNRGNPWRELPHTNETFFQPTQRLLQ